MKSYAFDARLVRPSLLAIAGALVALFAAAPDESSAEQKPVDDERILKTATVKLPFHSRATKVTYEDRNGVAVFEGDIVLNLGPQPPLQPWFIPRDKNGKALGSASKFESMEFSLSVRTGQEHLWPKGVVPYTINGNVGELLKRSILSAIGEYHKKTNVRFRPRTKERDYVEFIADEKIDAGGGSSPVGRQGKRQFIHLSQTITSPTRVADSGVVIHEIGHTLGLWHEHSRMDRDKHVRILWDNIESGQKHNFDRHVTDGIDFGPYDPNSIMHYGARAFGKDDGKGGRLTTIESLDPSVAVGQGRTFSARDVEGLNKLYPKVSESVTPPDGVPFLYHHPNFREGVALTSSVRHLSEVSMNDRPSGIRVPSGWTVTIYRHRDFKGASIEFQGPTEIPDLSKVQMKDAWGNRVFEGTSGLSPKPLTWNEEATSVIVSGPGANVAPACDAPTLFEHSYWRGRRLRLEENVGNLKDKAHKFNDIVSSLCVPEGWKVQLHEHPNFTGQSIEVVGPATLGNLHQAPDDRNWGDRFTSVTVTKVP